MFQKNDRMIAKKRQSTFPRYVAYLAFSEPESTIPEGNNP